MPNGEFCTYCQRAGHTLENCRSQQALVGMMRTAIEQNQGGQKHRTRRRRRGNQNRANDGRVSKTSSSSASTTLTSPAAVAALSAATTTAAAAAATAPAADGNVPMQEMQEAGASGGPSSEVPLALSLTEEYVRGLLATIARLEEEAKGGKGEKEKESSKDKED